MESKAKQYQVLFTARAQKQLNKLDKQTFNIIVNWIKKNLINCTNPRQHGKGLTANRSGQWRYRVGNYRLLADIQDDNVVILIIEVGHRKNIYE